MKKVIAGLFIFLLVLGGCSKDYWVWDAKDLEKEPAVRAHVNKLQEAKYDQKNYKLISTSLDKSTVVVSTGDPDVGLELVDVAFNEDETLVTVKEVEADGTVANPYILIHLEKRSGRLKVVNEEGEEYELVL